MLLLAQQVANALAGEAGWAGVGVLGLVLSWLMLKHLPAKDKQINEFIEAKDKHVMELTAKFEQNLDKIVDHCKEEFKIVLDLFRKDATMKG